MPRTPQATSLAWRSRAALCASTALQAAALVILTPPASAAPLSPPGLPVRRNAAAPFPAGIFADRQIHTGTPAVARDPGRTMLLDSTGRAVSVTSVRAADLLAGRVVIGQPAQPARVDSNAGNITLRQAGLAGLVAPRSANAGLMNARLGRVVLGGAPIATLDMYGDGLVALNVTRQVTQVSVGQHAVPGLVTNIGTVLAPGGTVALTAGAADGLVSSLVSPGRSAASGVKASHVLVSGIGGDIEVETGSAGAESGGRQALGGMSHTPQTARLQSGRLQFGRLQFGRLQFADFRAGRGAATAPAAVPAKTLPARHASSGRSGFDASGTLTVAETCTGIQNCLSFANFLADNSTIVDSNGAIIFAPGTLPPSQTLTSGATIVLTTTLGGGGRLRGGGSASGDIILENGLSLFAPGFTIDAAGSAFLNGIAAGSPVAPTALMQVTAAGNITEHPPGGQLLGSIDAQALIVSAGGSVTLDNPSNLVGALNGAAAPNGSFTFTDASGLSVTAPLTAGGAVSITVTGPGNGLTTSASIAAPSVALSASTLDIGGAVLTPLLAAQANAGSAAFTAGANMIGSITTLAGITGLQATGGIALADAESLAIGAPVSSPGQPVSIALGGAASNLTGTGAITAGQLDLSTPGSIFLQGGIAGSVIALSAGERIALSGAVDAGTLAALAGNGISLSNGSNAILSVGDAGALAGLQAGGQITLNGDTPLALNAGIATTGGNVAVTLTGSTSFLAGGFGIAGAEVVLSIGGSIALSGTVSASVLTAQAGGAIALTGNANQIVTIGSAGGLSGLSAAGNITVEDNAALTLSASVTSPGGTIALATTGAVAGSGNSLAGAGALTGDAIALSSAGSIALTGLLSTATLAARAGTSISLPNVSAGNIGAVGMLPGLQAGTGIALTDAQALAIAGPVGAGSGTVTIRVTGTGDGLTISGAVTAPELALNAAGSLDVTGAVDAVTLAARAGSSLAFTGGSNDIGTIGLAGTLSGLQAGGALTLDDNAALSIAAPVTATGAGLVIAVTGTGNTLSTSAIGGTAIRGDAIALSAAGGMSLDASVDAGTFGLALSGGTGGIAATGALTAGTLAAQAGGDIVLDASANSIATIGSAGALTGLRGRSVSLVDAGSLLLDSAVSVSATGGDVSLTTLGGGLTLSGSLVTSALAALTASGGDIVETGGVISAGTLIADASGQGHTGGAVTLGGANSVMALGDSSATGSFLLADGALTILAGASVSGVQGVTLALGGGSVTQDAHSLLVSSAGNITIDGGLVQEGGTLTAFGTAGIAGDVAQSSGGSIAGGTVSITGATLSQDASAITGSASIVIALTGDLTQSASGDLSSQGPMRITSTGGTLYLGGTIGTPLSSTLVLDASAGAITETAIGSRSATGTIVTGTLTGMAGGRTLLETASGAATGNQIQALGGFIAGGDFTLVDGAPALTVAGTLSAPDLILRTPALTVGASGAIEAAPSGTISLGADAYSLLGTVSAMGGLVALGLLHQGGFTLAAHGTPGETIDSASLLRIVTGTGTIALGTTDGTEADGDNGLGSGGTWTAATSGIVTSLAIQQALPLTGNAGALGLFSTGPIGVDGALSIGTLYGAAGGDFLATSANAMTDIGTLGLSAGGALMLTDTSPLTLDAGTASSITQLTGVNGVTLTLAGAALTQESDTSISSSLGAVMIDAALLIQDPHAAITADTDVIASFAVTQLGQDSIIAETGDYVSGTVQQDGGGLIQARAGALTIQGSASQTASTLAALAGAVTIEGTLSQTGATLTAGTSAAIDAGQSASGTTATVLTQTGASLLNAGTGAMVYGSVSQLASSLTGTQTVLIIGSLAQSQAAAISGGIVTIGGSPFAATLSQAGESSITAAHQLAVTLTGDLTQDATSALTVSAGDLDLLSSGGGLYLAGHVTALDGQVMLATGTGIITQAAPGAGATGTLGAATLNAAAGALGTETDDLLLDGTANAFATIDRATATGTVMLNDTTDATLAGQGLIGGNQAVTLTLLGHSLTQDSLSEVDSQAGAVTITAGALAQEAGASLSAAGNVTVALTGDLAQSTSGSIVSQAGSLVIHSSNGTLFLAGQDDAAAGLVDLAAANGDITEAAQGSGMATGAIQALTLAAQAGAPGGAAHDVLLDTAGGNAIGTLAGIDGTAASGASGAFVLTDQAALTIAAGTTLTGIGGVTLTLSPALPLTQGAASAIESSAGVQIQAGAVLQDDGASIAAAAGVTISGDLTQLGSNRIATLQGDIAVGGSASQTDSTIQAESGAAAIGGTLRQVAGTVLAGQDITIGGTLYPSGAAVTVLTQSAASLVSAGGNAAIAGGVIQDAASIMAAGTLTIDGSLAQTDHSAIGAAGVTIGLSGLAASLSQTASGITATNGALAISLTGNLTQDSASTLDSETGGISIASSSGGIMLAGTAEAPNGTMMLSAPAGTITETAMGAAGATGTILAGTLSAHAGTASPFDLLLDRPGVNMIGTITGASATGRLEIADAENLAIAAGAEVTGTQGVTFNLPGLTLIQGEGGSMASTDGPVTVDAALISQRGSILAATGFSQTGALQQVAGAIDVLSGPVTIGGDATQSLGSTIEAAAGSILIGGSLVQSTGSIVSAATAITVANSVSQTSSTLTAGGIVTLAGGGALAQLDGSLLSGMEGVSLTLAGGLTQDGTSAIQSGAGTMAIDATSGDIDFAGRLTAAASDGSFGGTTTIVASRGSILGEAGTLQTGVLAGSAAGSIDLGGAANQIGDIAAVGTALPGLAAGGTLQLHDDGALLVQDSVVTAAGGMQFTLAGGLTETANATLESLDGRISIESPAVLAFAGTLAAPQILLGDMTAPKQIIWNGGTILTGSSIPVPAPGIVPSIPNPIGPGNPLYAHGLFATAGNFLQSGSTIIAGLNGARQQTAEFTLTGPGNTIAFDPRMGFGLFAPTTQLLLDLQVSGRATGTIDVAGLNIYYYGMSTGTGGGGSTLTGRVDGHTGTAAAASGYVHSLPGVEYALNDCPIESLSCVLLSPIIVPPGSPVQDIVVSVERRQQEDDDLILPNVGEQDY